MSSRLFGALPDPNVAPLRGGPVLRWGILAPGAIASEWAASLVASTDQRLVAVGSRSLQRAQEFARAYGIDRAYGTYEQLVADPDIDIVYVAAPPSEHRRLALLAIAAGKHVLVEKPLALNAAEGREIAEAAKSAGVFAMEAMWSRFLPQTSVVRQLLDHDALGEVLKVSADFGAEFTFDPDGRMFDPLLGGGALLDVGVYPTWFAHFVLGVPERVTATGQLGGTGVDIQSAAILDYSSGAQATTSASMRVRTPGIGTVSGTVARLEFVDTFISTSSFRIVPADGSQPITWSDPSGFDHWYGGLCYQTAAAAVAIAEGRTESPQHSMSDAIEVLSILDAIRGAIDAEPPRTAVEATHLSER